MICAFPGAVFSLMHQGRSGGLKVREAGLWLEVVGNISFFLKIFLNWINEYFSTCLEWNKDETIFQWVEMKMSVLFSETNIKRLNWQLLDSRSSCRLKGSDSVSRNNVAQWQSPASCFCLLESIVWLFAVSGVAQWWVDINVLFPVFFFFLFQQDDFQFTKCEVEKWKWLLWNFSV